MQKIYQSTVKSKPTYEIGVAQDEDICTECGQKAKDFLFDGGTKICPIGHKFYMKNGKKYIGEYGKGRACDAIEGDIFSSLDFHRSV